MLEIKVVNKGHQPLPQYATTQSAGMDLRANLEEPVLLKPMERKLIPTGLHIALPMGYEAQVRPRSGLALKKGITVLNSPGTIDADYRGEVGVLLINLSQEDFVVNDGERIAQMVIARHEQGSFMPVDVLDETERGEGGFFSDWHYESRECQVCGYQETRKVSCNWSKKYKFADLEFCEDCFNIHDSRKQSEKLISKVELLTADGDALERTESIKDEAGHTHNVYDEDVNVVVTIDSINFNNEKTEDDWIKNMDVELCLNTPDKDVQKMSYVKNSMTSDGTAKFEYTVKVPVDKSLSIAGVKAKYTFDAIDNHFTV